MKKFNQDNIVVLLFNSDDGMLRVIDPDVDLLLTRKGLSKLLKLHISSIDRYVRNDKYNPLHLNGRVFFKLNQIIDAFLKRMNSKHNKRYNDENRLFD